MSGCMNYSLSGRAGGVSRLGSPADGGYIDDEAMLFTVRANPVLQQEFYPTGIESLDEALGGGLSPGLICLGGMSGLGKTTLAMQIVFELAGNGVPSIVFSLEMPKVILAGKEISRQTYLASPGRGPALTLKELRNADGKLQKDDASWAAAEEAARKVAAVGRKKVKVVRPENVRPTASEIADYVSEYIRIFGGRPLVLIDYLQILDAPTGMERATDKQIVDTNLGILRGMALRHDIPVLLISSMNRSGYEKSVRFSSFKESGGIEYACDTILGMQLAGISKPGFDLDRAVNACPRKVEIVVLKQRLDTARGRALCDFYAPYNHFESISCTASDEDAGQGGRHGCAGAGTASEDDFWSMPWDGGGDAGGLGF